MLWFAPQAFLFFQKSWMVICLVRVTYAAYNHAVVIFVQDGKTGVKLANRATFTIAISVICFKFHISLKKTTFLVRW